MLEPGNSKLETRNLALLRKSAIRTSPSYSTILIQLTLVNYEVIDIKRTLNCGTNITQLAASGKQEIDDEKIRNNFEKKRCRTEYRLPPHSKAHPSGVR
jgi:hypothetical protein